jgi:hypothetical protein
LGKKNGIFKKGKKKLYAKWMFGENCMILKKFSEGEQQLTNPYSDYLCEQQHALTYGLFLKKYVVVTFLLYLLN